MKKLTLIFALLLAAAAAAHAQVPNNNPAQLPNNNPGTDPFRDARLSRDPAKSEEALISASRASNARAESEADAVRRNLPATFNAEVEVTNSAAKTIKSVAWTATLLDSETGAVIRSYDVTTNARIAPGKTKKLSKFLRTPRANVVKVSSRAARRPPVADLKVKVIGVTYEDGSTSTTP
ncbi:MAG TPA: hypothetical protein VF297_13040 [Pyrinomonadaceae bacterium]